MELIWNIWKFCLKPLVPSLNKNDKKKGNWNDLSVTELERDDNLIWDKINLLNSKNLFKLGYVSSATSSYCHGKYIGVGAISLISFIQILINLKKYSIYYIFLLLLVFIMNLMFSILFLFY